MRFLPDFMARCSRQATFAIVSPKRSDDELRHLSEELSQADTEVLATRRLQKGLLGGHLAQAVLQDNLEEEIRSL